MTTSLLTRKERTRKPGRDGDGEVGAAEDAVAGKEIADQGNIFEQQGARGGEAGRTAGRIAKSMPATIDRGSTRRLCAGLVWLTERSG